MPTNCIGIIFLVVFAFKLKLFPLNGMTTGGLTGMARFWDIVWHAMLPVMIMVLFRTSSNFLLMKSNVSQIKDEDYTVTARSKGPAGAADSFPPCAEKNAMLPYITSPVYTSRQPAVRFHDAGGHLWLEGHGAALLQRCEQSGFPHGPGLLYHLRYLRGAGQLAGGDALVAAIDPRIKEGTVHA